MINENDRAFYTMQCAALDRLRGRAHEDICAKGSVDFCDGAFRFESMGRQLRVSYPDFCIAPEQNPWFTLSILHYLASADGTPLSGRQITFAQYKDGLIRGGGFDRDAEKAIQTQLGTMPAQELERRCLALGAKLVPSNADFCAEFRFMPNYPLWLKIWFADDEFPASGRILLDASAEHYLSVEDAVMLGTYILDTLSA